MVLCGLFYFQNYTKITQKLTKVEILYGFVAKNLLGTIHMISFIAHSLPVISNSFLVVSESLSM